MKTVLILQGALLVIVSYASYCTPRKDDPIVQWKGPNDSTDLVFFYKKDTTYKERELFLKTIIHKPDPQGRGDYLFDAVLNFYTLRNSGYEGCAINFAVNASTEQRARLKTAIESSPLVYKVYENIVPNKVQID